MVLSARLSPGAIFHLLKTTGAGGIIVSQRISEHPAFAKAKEVTKFHVGLPYSALHNADAIAVPNSATVYPEDVDNDILLLHSSGTTGLPKPISLTHRQLVFAVSHGDFDTEEEAQGVNISTLPLFHGFGLLAPGLAMSVGKTVCFPSPDRFASAQHIVELVERSKAASMMTVPFLLEDIISVPDGKGISALSKLDFVGTGGSALSAATGATLIANKVQLLNLYGTTETGPLTKTFVPKDNYDWKYFRLRSDIQFSISELDSYNGERRFRLTVSPFGASKPFEIADQLIRNDEYPDTDFAAVGRDDDVIVMATGEKVNPLLLETELTQSGMVKSAIVFGVDRFEIGLIVEPIHQLKDEKERDEFKDMIWPTIIKANEKMDATANIYSPESIIVVPAETIIPRTDKGSIARKEVYQLLEADIDRFYGNSEQNTIPAAPLDYENLEKGLKSLIQSRLALKAKEDAWDYDTNLFDLGLDSLQAITLTRMLRSAASQTPRAIIGKDFIYSNPTISGIAERLRDQSSSNGVNESPSGKIEQLCRKYSSKNISVSESITGTGAVVLLTGSSGSLGSYLLTELLKSSAVAKVICLLRKESAGSTGTLQDHKSLFRSKDVELAEDEWAKVSIQNCDPTDDHLGLSEETYLALATSATHCLHAAWPMNFHMHLSSFNYQFSYLKNLLSLVLSKHDPISKTRTRFLFVSSIAALAKSALTNAGQIIPEKSLSPDQDASGIGYADAKLVCEKILEEAGQIHSTKLEIGIVRCGQLTGSTTNCAWNENEQIPMLVKTAQSLKILPQLHGVCSLISVPFLCLLHWSAAENTNNLHRLHPGSQ